MKSNKFTKEYQQVLFSLRNKTYPFKINFKKQFINNMQCRICLDTDSIEDFEHTIECRKMKMFVDPKQLKLEYIYGSEEEKLEFIEAFIQIHRVRQTIIEVDESYSN